MCNLVTLGTESADDSGKATELAPATAPPVLSALQSLHLVLLRGRAAALKTKSAVQVGQAKVKVAGRV